MTYVEFFDKNSIENICACLCYAPNRVVLIGDNEALINRYIKYYEEIFSSRGNNIEFLCKTVSKNRLDCIVTLLTEIVDTYDDCVFDITGGCEMYNLALGIVCSKYSGRALNIHRINLSNNMVYDCDKDGNTISNEMSALSISENVKAYGGKVVYGDIEDEKATYLWALSDDFKKDIDLIWNICKKDVRYWNVQINVFDAMCNVGRKSEDGTTITASREAVERYLKKKGEKYKKAKGIISYLRKNGLITCFDDETTSDIIVSFKDDQIKKILTTAGKILELKTYLLAKDLKDKNGSPIYNDALNGVFIDWDGVLHDEKKEGIYDTENEIDVFLMHGAVPMFISCKNGFVDSNELYKLETVATRFGGDYAKKILVTTSLDSLGDKGKYVRQRANDMKIKLVENVHELDDKAFAKKLNNLWKN